MSKIGAPGGSPVGGTSRQQGNPPPSLQEGETAYTVQRGDTMSQIARQHGMPFQTLSEANPQIQDASRIWPGDQIRIPGAQTAPSSQSSSSPAQQYYGGDQFAPSNQSQRASTLGTTDIPRFTPAPSIQSSPTQRTQGANVAPPPGMTTAGQLAAGATIAGAPLEGVTRLAQQSADTVRGYADTARGQAARVFAEGGEEALRATRAHQTAARLETAAARTAQTSARLRTAGTALNLAGGALTAVDQYQNSSAQTTAGRLASSSGAGSLTVAVGARHPYFAAADAAANLLGAPDTPSNVLNRSVDTIATVAEGIATGDTRGMETLHQRNLRGDHGPIFQAAAEAGDYWAEHGVVGGLSEFGGAVGDLWSSIWD